MLNANRSRLIWQALGAFIALIVTTPLLVLLLLSADASSEIWRHLSTTVLSDYMVTTSLLVLGVIALSAALGVTSAVVISRYTFAGSKTLSWALILPLAMPAYIIAYSYTGLLDVAGPLQSGLRAAFNWQFGDYWFPQIRSLGGAIFVLSFVLYPYVYLLTKAALQDQSTSLYYAATSTGAAKWRFYLRVSLPLARPAMVAGLALVAMETLADYGAVSYFGLSTFTTGIFRTWFGLDSIANAAQLALLLLCFVTMVVIIEKQARRRAAYYSQFPGAAHPQIRLRGKQQCLAFAITFLPVLIGFIVPVLQLSFWAIDRLDTTLTLRFWSLVYNTMSLAVVAAIVIMIGAILSSYAARFAAGRWTTVFKTVAGFGYAVPGLVIAVGVLAPLAWLDHAIDAFSRNQFNASTGLLFSGTLIALIAAYLVRFLTLGINNIDSGLARIHPNMEQAARTLGAKPWVLIGRVHLPLLRNSVATGFILVLVDVIKELPATLVLRPFNFDTLAVRAFELASDERLADASVPSLAIVLVGLIPVILLARFTRSDS